MMHLILVDSALRILDCCNLLSVAILAICFDVKLRLKTGRWAAQIHLKSDVVVKTLSSGVEFTLFNFQVHK